MTLLVFGGASAFDYNSGPPTQPSYLQSYNYNSNESYRQPYDFGRQPANGSQPGGYQQQSGYPQQYGYPPASAYPADQRSGGRSPDTAREGTAARESGSRRGHRRRHRLATREGWADNRPRYEVSGGEPRHPRVRTTLPAAGSATPVPQGGGWYGYGQIVACVRTCDGYFFPMGLATDQASIAGQKSLCTALCPEAKTELYFMPQGADGIATAISADGRAYSKMPRALRYTKTVDNACTCRGSRSQSGLVALMKDFTLRRGDAVMTVNGVLVFNGAWRWPYRLSDFQVLDKAKYYLSNALALAALERAAMRLQQAVRRPGKGEKALAAAPFNFITDNTGKMVRLVGDALSYAPGEATPLEATPPAAPSTAAAAKPAAETIR